MRRDRRFLTRQVMALRDNPSDIGRGYQQIPGNQTRKRKAMLDAQTLADRYVAVWNEADANNRRAAVAALWVPDGQHYVAGREARGYEALEERIRGSHEKNVRDNGNRFRAARDARRLRDVVTFHWEMLRADGATVLATGLEFLIIDDDGRVLADYQFFPA